MRTLIVIALVSGLGCGGSPLAASGPGGDPAGTATPRMDLQCTPQPDFDEAACAARGCGYQPPLICRGIDVGDEQREREREERASGRLPCTCVCPVDVEQCAMVP